jgi:ketosteroid isomerase-like protein
MPGRNEETVRRAVAAANQRDIDHYLTFCTEDIELVTPWSEMQGSYEREEGIRRFFADIEDTQPDFQVEIERLEEIGNHRVLTFMRATASGRTSGLAADLETANVYDLVDGRIRLVRIFMDRRDALAAAGLAE